jgi:hypothetical protein
MLAGDEQVLLRDDGEGGDEAAGDGLFTVALQENLDSLQGQLNRLQALRVQAFRTGAAVRFGNRSAQTIKELRPLDTARFVPGKTVRLDELFDIIFSDINLRTRSLMINDISVVEDPARTFNPCTGTGTPNGAWTFEKLMRELANTPATGTTVEAFTRNWLESWMRPTTINGDNLDARASIFSNVIRPWLVKSGADAAAVNETNWQTFPLDMKFAPFKLLAIVNRLDLRGNTGYSLTNAGEGRFVFGALNLNSCTPMQFTAIFEYGINKRKCSALQAFARQWYNLKSVAFGPAFNSALQAITDQFVLAGTSPSRPNGSSLNQLRTNEVALRAPWELREFNINGTNHFLDLVTVKREPAKIYNRLASPAAMLANQQKLATWANSNAASILDNTFEVPPTLPSGEAFLGGKAHTEGAPPPLHFWDGSNTEPAARITDDSVRHILSLNTCSGCHGGEGKTQAFTHVEPSNFGFAAQLSGFLTGQGTDANPDPFDDDASISGLFFVRDPANRPTPATVTIRGFNDLKRRADDLERFISFPCSSRVLSLLHHLKFKPVNMTH